MTYQKVMEKLECLEEKIDLVDKKINHLHREVRRMAVDQATFDQELAALVAAILELNTAVDALIESKPAADFTEEETLVQQAAQAVADELAKISPPAAEGPPPEETPPSEPT